VKKQTRRWAAWTRQEEESFFSALRQVGKNFDKITCRVQSKNKDQVRHYYYRLLRRMNKLLDPDLCLNAKNSKYTNTAMLRWWSLLEKYSCKASKLHLKPRRFKIFVENLENQLLRDRKKSMKRRVSSGENNSSFHNIPSSDQIKSSGHDCRAIKVVLESQNVNNKVGKTSNRRWKRGDLHTFTAYKRWEKAAIAGVSLVADAAEHLERVDTDKEIENSLDGSRHGPAVAPQRVASPPYNIFKESVHSHAKIKLQLFPVDERTRRILEVENHNPHLELTLSTRKKISSVLEHLNRKWRNTSFQSRDLVLFPFWVQGENLLGYQKWTKESPFCAADVYCLVGSPATFRLRYGWFSRDEMNSGPAQLSSQMDPNDERAKTCSSSEAANTLILTSTSRPCESLNLPVFEQNSSGGLNDETALIHGRDISHISVVEHNENMVYLAYSFLLSAGEWANTLTDDVTLRDLLSGSGSLPNMDTDPAPLISNGVHHQMLLPFSCDSFDAAIAAHIYKHQNRTGGSEPGNAPPSSSSIWEAEETRDAFSFQKPVVLRVDDDRDKAAASSTSYHTGELPADVDENLTRNDDNLFGDHNLAGSTKDLGGLTDIYWPESLGPLELDVAPAACRYSTDLILSDSLSGFNWLVANSLDAFQNWSFFGFDKKE
ncbi:hypothetical protein M569_02804, partial [Genlisea aurea]